MIYEYFRITGTIESALDFSDLMNVTLRGDGVQGFDTKWDEVFFFEGNGKRKHFGNVCIPPLPCTITIQCELASYTRLKKMVKKYLDQKTRVETSMPENARAERAEPRSDEKVTTEVKRRHKTRGL